MSYIVKPCIMFQWSLLLPLMLLAGHIKCPVHGHHCCLRSGGFDKFPKSLEALFWLNHTKSHHTTLFVSTFPRCSTNVRPSSPIHTETHKSSLVSLVGQ